MANILSGQPLVLDTASATVLFPGWLKIGHFMFSDYTADAHTAVLQDASGRVIWSVNGKADLSPVNSEDGLGWILGLKCTTLDSGKVYVYVQ